MDYEMSAINIYLGEFHYHSPWDIGTSEIILDVKGAYQETNGSNHPSKRVYLT
jgi:hypothetical protein